MSSPRSSAAMKTMCGALTAELFASSRNVSITKGKRSCLMRAIPYNKLLTKEFEGAKLCLQSVEFAF